MRYRPGLLFAASVAFLAIPAMAEEEDSTKPHEIVDIEMPVIIAPMVVNGRLEHYAYITITLTPSSAGHIFDVRSRVPYLQDAFLREVNRASIVKASDHNAVDTEALKARLMARMKGILPPDAVSAFKFEKIVVAPMRPEG